MSFIEEESKREKELRLAVEKAAETDPDLKGVRSKESLRRDRAKAKDEARRKDYEQKQATLETKRDRLEWQKERSKIKDKLRKEAEEKRKNRGNEISIKTEPISDKDKDPTAYKKGIGNLASFAGGVAKLGASAIGNQIRKRKEDKNQRDNEAKEAQQQREEDAAERGKSRIKKRTKAALDQSSRLLPSAPSQMSGREKRTAISQGKYLGKGKIVEEYSCWREAFLYELGDMRRKKKKSKDGEDYVVEVMPENQKNSITINPTIKENYLHERKRDHLANALLGLAFATNVAQSPSAAIRSGHIEGPGMQLMSRMMQRRKEANRNLDSGRVSHPARNIKKNDKPEVKKSDVKEALDKRELLKSIVKKLIDEKKRKNYLLNSGYIGEENIEEVAAWQRKEGKNPEGGLNAKGVASYRAQNPGSELQTAVTTKPSKLKPGSKDAKRRKSFCARMGGMSGPMKDEKGRPTRKSLSLRKWNC